MTNEEIRALNNDTYQILGEQLSICMNERALRLSQYSIWLKGWLRFHKIKREYRKMKRIRDLCRDYFEKK